MKIYNKIDYLKNDIEGPLGKILQECFENFLCNNSDIRNTVLENTLCYKLTLQPGTKEYDGCSDILESNFSNITYTWIAEKIGYELIANPRRETDRLTLDSFEHDISHGNLQPSEEYSGEYFSLAFEFLRRNIIINSILWGESGSKEIMDVVNCMRKRWDLFNRYFSDNFYYPLFMVKFTEIKWNPNFYELCFSPLVYEQWDLTWEKFTGHNYHEWTRVDQIYQERYNEAIEQYLDLHINMTTNMNREELLYFAELSLYQGCSVIWKFLNGDCDGEYKNNNLNKLLRRLDKVGSIDGAGLEKYKDMSNNLKNEASTYYDLDKVQEIINWRVKI